MKKVLFVIVVTSSISQYGFTEDECSICIEIIKDGEQRILECDHIYHKICIKNWLKIKPLCPVCNFNVITGKYGLYESEESESGESESGESESGESESGESESGESESEESEPEEPEPEEPEPEEPEPEEPEPEEPEPEEPEPEEPEPRRFIKCMVM